MIDVRFVQSADERETLRTSHLDVTDAWHIRDGAEARGCPIADGGVLLYGVNFAIG